MCQPLQHLLQSGQIDAGVEGERADTASMQARREFAGRSGGASDRLPVQHQFQFRDADRERRARREHRVERGERFFLCLHHHGMRRAVGAAAIERNLHFCQKRNQAQLARVGGDEG